MKTEILDNNLAADTDAKADLVAASKGKRIANFIIDYLAAMVFTIVVGFFLDAIGIIDIYTVGEITDRIISILVYVLYYLVFEITANGKTIGKWITGTRAINIDGEDMEPNQVIGRTFSRLVPFEPFSFMGESTNGWHDKWSKTTVVDERLTSLKNLEQAKEY